MDEQLVDSSLTNIMDSFMNALVKLFRPVSKIQKLEDCICCVWAEIPGKVSIGKEPPGAQRDLHCSCVVFVFGSSFLLH